MCACVLFVIDSVMLYGSCFVVCVPVIHIYKCGCVCLFAISCVIMSGLCLCLLCL